MVRGCLRAGWPVLLSLLAACSTTPLRGQPNLLDFLADGATPRSEVVARLGQPTRCLRSGEICTYRVAHDEAGQYVKLEVGGSSWMDTDGSLVVVFDADGVLQRHSIVRVREP
jgi:hypothetical protein